MPDIIEESIIAESVKSNMFVTFIINNEVFGINVMKVEEIIGHIPVTQIPNTPEYMKGVIDLRGKVVPVIDLRLRFNITGKKADASTVILIVNIREKSMGFIVDAVLDVADMPVEIMHEYSRIDSGTNNNFVISIADLDGQLVLILDIDRIIDEVNVTFPGEITLN